MSKDYLKFLSNIRHYLSLEMVQIKKIESNNYEYLKNKISDDCVIGRLGDVEIYFLHYHSFEDAKKIVKRSKRINYKNLIIKYSDQNGFEEEDLIEFEKLNFKNKVFITTKRQYINQSIKTICIDDVWGAGYAKDDIKPSLKTINLLRLLNCLEKE